jgi:hypothetical protein
MFGLCGAYLQPGHQNKEAEEVKTNVKSFPVVETGDVVWA